jgi:hypothetical protein
MKRRTASARADRAEHRAGTDERAPGFEPGNFAGLHVSDYEFMMSLRIRHPHIDPAEITMTLRVEPQHTWRAGDLRRGSAGDELGGTHRESYWMGRLMTKPELARDHVDVESEILRALGTLRRSFDLLKRLKEEGGSAELHVSLYAREEFRLELLPESLALLGRLGLALALDVKPNPEDSSGVALN